MDDYQEALLLEVPRTEPLAETIQKLEILLTQIIQILILYLPGNALELRGKAQLQTLIK